MASMTISPEPNQSSSFAAIDHDLQGAERETQGARSRTNPASPSHCAPSRTERRTLPSRQRMPIRQVNVET